MKKLYLILLLIFISVVAHAQPYETNPDFNRTRNWHFGHGVGLRFDPDTIYEVQSSIHTGEAAAVHTDQDGNLLLYSNGEKIWNSSHQEIHNGNLSLGHNSSRMGSVFVFHEDNPDSIYLFNTFWNLSTTKEFSVNLIVRESDTFRVAFKDSILLYDVCEPIAVVKAENGIDIWVVVHKFEENNIYSYLLTSDGLVTCAIVSNSISTPIGVHGAYLSMTFSSNGKYMAKCNTNLPPPSITKGIEIYNFDANCGSFDYLYSIDNPLSPLYLGVCFSPDNKSLFVVERDSGVNAYRFNPEDSLTTVSSIRKFKLEEFSSSLQKMPYKHGVIASRTYTDGYRYLDFIVNTDDFDSLKVLEKKININYSGTVPPNFNQTYFYTPPINFTVKLNCVLNTVQFYGQDTFSAIFHDWFITKQGSMPITNNSKTPLIQFNDTGLYEVKYIASNENRSDTIIKSVTILPKIDKHFLGNDTGWCNTIGSPIALQAPNSMHCYEWNTGETAPHIAVDTAGVYIAKVTTPNFCVIYDTVMISVDTIETITSGFLGDDKYWCENIDTSVVLKAIDGYDSYTWNNNSTEQQIIANENGIYYIEAFKRNQCSNGGNLYAYDTIQITLLNAPEKPTLNREEDSLFINLSGNHTYNWYHDNKLLNDTTEYLILPDTGYYFLMVTNENGCSNNSDTLYAATLGLESIVFSSMKIYPNPSNGVFTVEVLYGEYSFAIKGITGKILKEGQLNNGVNQIDINYLPNGIYFITAYNNEQTITYKLIKQSE